MFRGAFVVALSVSLTFLAGCAGTTWSVKGSYEKDGVKIEGSISGTEKAQGASADSAHSTLDASEFVLDLTGTTFAVPQNGMLTVSLTSAGTTSPRISARFAWVRSGEFVFLSNPAQVEQWLGQHGLSDDVMKYQLDTLPDTTQAGVQETIAVASVYEGQITANSSHTFTGGRSNGCRLVRCHQQ